MPNEEFNSRAKAQSSIVISEDSEGQVTIGRCLSSERSQNGPWIPAKGESFYYEEDNRLDILFAIERAPSFLQEPWKLSQNTTTPSDWLMNNGEPNSEGQSLLNSTMPLQPEAEEQIIKDASNIAGMMKSPKIVYLPKTNTEEVVIIRDSDEKGNVDNNIGQAKNEDIITIEDSDEDFDEANSKEDNVEGNEFEDEVNFKRS